MAPHRHAPCSLTLAAALALWSAAGAQQTPPQGQPPPPQQTPPQGQPPSPQQNPPQGQPPSPQQNPPQGQPTPPQGQPPATPPQPQQPPATTGDQTKPPPAPDEKPLDSTQSAAEVLLRALRGETKPVDGPPRIDPTAAPPNEPLPQQAPPGGPPPQGETPQGEPQQPEKPKPVDETGNAAGMIEGRAPGIEPRTELPQGADAQHPGQVPPEQPVDETHAAAEVIEGQPDAAAAPLESGLAVHGSLFFEWRHRDAQSGDQDSDLLGALSLDVGDPTKDDVSGHVLGRAQLDLDDKQSPSPFNGIDETYSSALTGFLYEAYADFHSIPGLAVARVGRQTLWDTPEILFLDGVRAETKELGEFGLQLGGYFGLPTQLYNSIDTSARLEGAMVGARPWRGGRLRFDWTHSEDHRDGIEFNDDLFGISGWQSIDSVATLNARFNWLNSDPRDLFLSGETYLSDLDLQARVSYRELLTTQKLQTVELDPYWTSAFDYYPYRQLSLLLSKGLTEHLTASGGFDMRRLKDSGDEAQFNRDFERYYLTGAWATLHPLDLAASATVDWWNSGGEETFAVGADITVRPMPMFRTSLGTYYSLYKSRFVLPGGARERAYGLRALRLRPVRRAALEDRLPIRERQLRPLLRIRSRTDMELLTRLRLLVPLAALLVAFGCHVSESEEQPSRFSHARHVGEEMLDCSMCHARAKTADQPGMPGPQVCMVCHEGIQEEKPETVRIATLFDASGHWTGGVPRAQLPEELHFSHKAHASEDCSKCHGNIAESAGIPAPHLSMDECMSCHAERGASRDCSVCHQTISRKWEPPTHELGWEQVHGKIFRAKDPALVNRCSLCHDEETSCRACHALKKPRDHTTFWRIGGHGVAVSIDRSRCFACHRTDFCERCHQNTQPLTHTAGWGSPMNRHCTACHYPLTESGCITCHKGTPSHASAPPMPGWHDPAMNCRLCHGAGAPLPHPDPGTQCTVCHR